MNNIFYENDARPQWKREGLNSVQKTAISRREFFQGERVQDGGLSMLFAMKEPFHAAE